MPHNTSLSQLVEEAKYGRFKMKDIAIGVVERVEELATATNGTDTAIPIYLNIGLIFSLVAIEEKLDDIYHAITEGK